MKRRVLMIVMLVAGLWPAAAFAHPIPFTYLDVRLQPGRVDISLVAHVFDVSHDLAIADQMKLMDPAVVESRRAEILALFTARLTVDSRNVRWTDVRVLRERSSIQIVGDVESAGGALPIHAHLFPYDPAHQTFVNVYESDALTLQAILDGDKTELVYFPGSRQGIVALIQRFAPDGARHILSGAEHWLFLVGILLLGARGKQVGRIALAFLAADVLTTTLIVLNVVHPAAKLTDPALALTVVYVGADNLMVRGGRDVRPWSALAFGVLHGFWFGGGLALMDLPRAALGWSLAAFNLGALAAATGIMLALAAALRVFAPGGRATEVVQVTGSVAVIAGGVLLFVQRVFFPGGLL